jgi:hypothetical protein
VSVTPAQLDFAIRARAAFDAAMTDAHAAGTGFIRIMRTVEADPLPKEVLTIERLDPETVEVEHESDDRAPEPENFE